MRLLAPGTRAVGRLAVEHNVEGPKDASQAVLLLHFKAFHVGSGDGPGLAAVEQGREDQGSTISTSVFLKDSSWP